MNLFYRAVFKIRVGDLEVHHVRFHRCILSFLLFQLLFFIFKLHPADISDSDSSANNTEHAKRVCAGISVCNLRYLSGREDCRQSLIGSTKARSVGHGSIERSNHHWQVVVVACVEENEIACEHNCDIKQDQACRQDVKRNTTFSETFKETGTNLKSNHEHEQDKSEILYERQDIRRSCKSDMACGDACKQYECHSK